MALRQGRVMVFSHSLSGCLNLLCHPAGKSRYSLNPSHFMLDGIIQFSIKNKFIIGLLTFALVVWGVWSASRLPIDAVPDITNNQVQIITLCPTLATQEVEQLVTYPIEKSLANLPDLVEMRSISRFGLSVVTVVFDDDVNVWFARQLINEKIKEAILAVVPPLREMIIDDTNEAIANQNAFIWKEFTNSIVKKVLPAYDHLPVPGSFAIGF